MIGSTVHFLLLRKHPVVSNKAMDQRLDYSWVTINGVNFMTITIDNTKYKNALKSIEAKRKLSEARGYAAGASILANNNPKFIRWGKRAQFLVTAFFSFCLMCLY